MSNKLLRSGFQSEIDIFLQTLDKKRTTLPDSVRKEIDKNDKIAKKRDGLVEEEDSPIWKEF
ncbi:MAG: hypothetical protein JSS07_05220 [Proteobacteria bacterium]|nr:hypothetical protein [Pseudomonadota bacterium]